MKRLRKLHLYLGCAFAPLILYFALSGIWQTFRLNVIAKDEAPTAMRSFFHELSKPHKSSTLPGGEPKEDKSVLFQIASAAMGLGLALTTVLGLVIAVRSARKRVVVICLVMGAALPIVFLFVK